MKAAAFDYLCPATLPDALRALDDAASGSKPMAGSQSMGPMLNLRLMRPARVLDISRLEALRGVTRQGDGIRIGAGVTHAEIEDGRHEAIRGGFLQHVAATIAYRAIRNRGTIGGSLAHADPAADWPLALTALDAMVELASLAGTRQLGMADFFQGAFTTALREGEIVSAVILDPPSPALRWGYHKLCRKTGEFPHASCAAAFSAPTRLARIVIGALDGPPRRLVQLEQDVARAGTGAVTPSAIAAAIAAALPEADAIDRRMRIAVVDRCLNQVFDGQVSNGGIA